MCLFGSLRYVPIWQPAFMYLLHGSLRYVPIWQPAFMYLLHGSLRLGDDYIMLHL